MKDPNMVQYGIIENHTLINYNLIFLNDMVLKAEVYNS